MFVARSVRKQVQQVIWNSAKDVWETSERSDVYSETWPTSGMTVNGVAYELPTWVPPTPASAYSSSQPDVALLGTPRTAQAVKNDLRDPDVIGNPRGRMEDQISLLRTPTSQLAVNGGSQHPDKRKAGGRAAFGEHSGGSLAERPDLPDGPPVDWGPYEPAIRRWEQVLGRKAPAPTEITSKGKHRLSPKLTEFMMGLPAGWVTDVPISRNDQLKACGNGVVPQQATLALREMLDKE